MPGSDELTQRVVAAVPEHRHLEEFLRAVHEGEPEAVRDDRHLTAVDRGQPKAPVSTP